MARPREFNETDAVQSAMNCFWQRGYEATSMRDLAASMGMSAPSLYNAFGDKQGLFARALERYLDCNARDLVRRLESSLPPKEAIQRFFAEILDHSINDRERKGCFLVNSALEVAPHQKELGAVIAKQFGEIEAFSKGAFSPRKLMERRRVASMQTILPACCSACFLAFAFLRGPLRSRSLLQGVVRPALALLDLPRRKRKRTR
jgi:TetR/AcrR family transcriptional repressor of nem operon